MPASAPSTRDVLLESLGVCLENFRCRAHVEPLGPEETHPAHGIALVRQGVFGREVKGETLVVDANHVLFFNAGEAYRYSHPLSGGDDCTVITFDAPRAQELVAHHAPRDAARSERPFALSHGLSSPRAARLHYELLGLVRRDAPRLVVEDAVAELADEAVGAAYRSRGARREGEPASALARRRARDLAEAVKVTINDRREAPPSLGELARGHGCSPFHLSRTFRRMVGVSLRRYAGRLRTRLAAVRLAAGAPDLTALALDLGYADHSHFTNAFRQEWGVPPSRFRDGHRA